MKKTTFAVLIAFGLLFAICAQAQLATNSPEGNFLNTAVTWGTSFNTNSEESWTNVSLQFDTGISTITGSGISDRLYAQKNIDSFGLGVMGQFEGIGSAFGEIEGTVAYNIFQKYDFKLDVELGAGYDFNAQNRIGAMVVEPGTGIFKKMTATTYANFRLSFPVETRGKFNANPGIYVGMGATF